MKVLTVVVLALIALTLTVGTFFAYAWDLISGDAAAGFIFTGIAAGIATVGTACSWGEEP